MDITEGIFVSISVIHPIYNTTPEVIAHHVKTWKKYGPLLPTMEIILIDDGSTEPLLVDIDYKINLKIVRISKDIYWNIGGALNLGYMIAENNWCVTCDIDHSLTESNLRKLFYLQKEKGNIYFFKRMKGFKEHKPNAWPNIYCMNRGDYWSTGGYDEDLAGNGGYNDSMIQALMRKQRLKFVKTDIEIEMREEFAYTANHVKKGREVNAKKVNAKRKEISNMAYEHPPVLNFPWHITKDLRYTIPKGIPC